tara:strand:+ start:12388 stop:13701 length:1314 start_codon:yes stop_codon:yes gene_type:complete
MSKFSGFFDNFSASLGNPKGNLGDYAHASALYVRNNLRLTPKIKFLFHVVLDINASAIAQLGAAANVINKREVNLLVESAQLPSYQFDTSTLNMYNRKKIVQTKINYEPIEMVFHDDQAGLTTLLWELYFRYYYQDPNYAQNNLLGQPDTNVPRAFNNDQVYHYKSDVEQNYRYGLDKTRITNNPFFNSITINQLHPQDAASRFTSVTLINPMISQFSHDTMQQGESAFTKNTMRIEYESVMYGRGDTERDNPAGFADPAHYDTAMSPLTLAGGGVSTLFGAGGVVNGFASVFSDLSNGNFNLSSGLTLYNTLQNAQNLSSTGVGNEFYEIKQDLLNYAILSGINAVFPNNNNNANTTQTTQYNNPNSTQTSNADTIEFLSNNQTALDNFTFNTVFKDSAYQAGFTGNLNDLKTDFDSLPRSTKNQLNTITLDRLNQ